MTQSDDDTNTNTQAPKKPADVGVQIESSEDGLSMGGLSLGGLLGLAPDPSERQGELIDGRYRLGALLGRGGMGMVYRGTQLNLGREVAIKLVRPQLGVSPEVQRRTLERFDREMATTAQLEHPNIVRLYDVGATDGQVYMAMELLEGETLRALIQNQAPLPVKRAIHIGLQLCSALQAAHERGIIHRDLKPANVMVRDAPGHRDVVTVLDFGLAQLTQPGSAERLTQDGTMLGTPGYAAPEQIRAGIVDERADIYALGAILYELLTSSPPFVAATALDLLHQHSHAAVQRPSSQVALPPALDGLLMELLAKDPGQRPSSASEAAKRLVAIDTAPGTRSDGAPTPNIGLRVAALIVVGCLCAVGLWALWPPADGGAADTLSMSDDIDVDGAGPAPDVSTKPLALEAVDLNRSTATEGGSKDALPAANVEAGTALAAHEMGHVEETPGLLASKHRMVPPPAGKPGRWRCLATVSSASATTVKIVIMGPSSRTERAFPIKAGVPQSVTHKAGIPKAQLAAYRCVLMDSNNTAFSTAKPSQGVSPALALPALASPP